MDESQEARRLDMRLEHCADSEEAIGLIRSTIRRVVAAAVEEEREACAKIAAARTTKPKQQGVLPCGCVTCVCEDDWRCYGCGAKTCADYPRCRSAPKDASATEPEEGDALDALQEIVARWDTYRIQHDTYGDGSRQSGWAWDQMQRSAEKAKQILRAQARKQGGDQRRKR